MTTPTSMSTPMSSVFTYTYIGIYYKGLAHVITEDEEPSTYRVQAGGPGGSLVQCILRPKS